MRYIKKPLIALAFGTRPEIIKLSPVIRALEKKGRFILIHTGQHYSYEMDSIFFRELGLPRPKYHFSIAGKRTHGQQTALMTENIENVLMKEKPAVLLVQGDTNSVLAGTLAAAKLPAIRIGHIEAGLRSYDRAMPEEINRVACDHLSHFLFAPTADSKKTLLGEGIDPSCVFVTGNTIVDAVRQNLELARRKSGGKAILQKPYMIMTLHRPENVDNKTRLVSILSGVSSAAKKYGMLVYFSVHPRTAERLKAFGLQLPHEIKPLKPVSFLDFLLMESRANLIVTDSGGIQEEACILKVPCVTLRLNTERPETVKVGGNKIAGYRPEMILAACKSMISRKRNWSNPFGDGHSGERIVRITWAGCR